MKMLPLELIRFLFRRHKAIKNRILRTWNKNRIGSERRFEGNFHQPRQGQAKTYNEKLDQAFQRLQQNPEIGHSREDILPSYRALVAEQHLIIYWMRERNITVIRILHQRQDPSRHL